MISKGEKRTPVLRESREYKWHYGSTGVRREYGSTENQMGLHKEYKGLFYLFVIFFEKKQNKVFFFVLNSYNDLE
jgi:hypothetical protein